MKTKTTLGLKKCTALMFVPFLILASCEKNTPGEDSLDGLSRSGERIMATSGSSSLLIESTFEEPDALSERYWGREAANANSITRSSEHARNGQFAVKFILNKSDADVNGSKRAELKHSEMPVNAERWYGLSVYLPSSYSTDRHPESFFQWHNIPNFGRGENWGNYKFKNPFRMETNNGRFVFVHQFSSVPSDANSPVLSKSYDLGAYETGKWTDWVIHFKLSYKSDGLFEIWKNGQKVMTINGPNYYNDESGPYFKMGIYKWGFEQSPINQRILYIDEVKVGNQNSSYNDVSPSGTSTSNDPDPNPAPTPEPAPTPAPAPSHDENSVVFAVNAGGPAFKASNGITYQADKNYSGGTAYNTSMSIGNTVDDVLYQTERSGGNFSYNIPVSNGTYEVMFRFAETHFTKPYQRVFNFQIEGNTVVSNLDLVSKVGRGNAYAIVKTVTVSDGTLNIQSYNRIDNANLAAFHVIKR